MMRFVAIVGLLALLQYVYFGIAVGRARGRYGVKGPAVSGHEVFERYFRVQQNTLELLVAFLPALWLFALYASATWAIVLGAVYLAGRVLYYLGYVRDPPKRELGFALSMLPILVLIVGALVGALLAAS
ncbi:MAG TPA: MAPEG family protein [Steroidobacteraceae bacterium]|nr:MAPEG family protein [Steroidobacteraceae bacterium]